MRDGSESSSSSFHPARPKRLPGSCDRCWKRKVRCDRAETLGTCTNCSTLNVECTHARGKGAKPRVVVAPQNSPAKHQVAEILSTSKIYVPSSDPNVIHQTLVEVAEYARSLEKEVFSLRRQISQLQSPSIDSNSQHSTLASEHSQGPGNSSTTVLDLEDQPPHDSNTISTPNEGRGNLNNRSMQFLKAAVRHVHGGTSVEFGVQWMRTEFWTPQPWEKHVQHQEPQLSFPEADLLETLTNIYFERINPILHILHSTSFRQSIAEKRHLRDPHFGAVLLVACALASRYSNDPRVFIDGNTEHSCGWKWFSQVRPLRTTFSPEHALHQLQLIGLSLIFLTGTAMATADECWILAGLGLRFAQAAGAHSRKGYARMEPLTAELYRRVVWLLKASDSIMSSIIHGRPTVFHSNEWELDPPANCDEEYWGIPGAIQPPDKPSSSHFIGVYHRLLTIFWRIISSVYPSNGQIGPEEVIIELDSALNQWVDEIPDHLKWDPQQDNQIFLDQSAVLYAISSSIFQRANIRCSSRTYATYYHAQILLHRPFIPAPGRPISINTSFPSLAICANAARSCGHVLNVQTQRGHVAWYYPSLTTVLFDCAIVLLVNVWAVVGEQKPRIQQEQDFLRAKADVQNCLHVLRVYERRLRIAGRRCDMISALLNLQQNTSKALSPPREAEAQIAPSVSSTTATFFDRTQSSPVDAILSPVEQMEKLEQSIQETDHLFSLPLRTEELGRLPIYNSFDYEFASSNDSSFPHEGISNLLGPRTVFDFSLSSSNDLDGALMAPDEFDMFSNYQWGDWSSYLARMDQ